MLDAALSPELLNVSAISPDSEPITTHDASRPTDWVDRHGDVLYALAMRAVHDPATAEDLVQETFLGALRNKATFRGEAAEQTWLVSILRHKVLDHLGRSAPPVPLDQHDDLFKRNGTWASKPKRWLADPTDNADREELMSALRSCLARLPQSLSDLLHITERSDAPARVIGAELGLSEANVWTRLYRARTALRECLSNQMQGRDRS